MPGATRTFLAAELPRSHKELLRQLEEQLSSEARGVRWVAPELCHLTLAFLGDVPDTDLELVNQTALAAAAGVSPFELVLAGLGAFPNPARPRVVWAGLSGAGLDSLNELQRAVATALSGIGHPPTDNRFSPHVTIGRIKQGRGPAPNLTALLARHQAWSAGAFEVSEVITFASVLAPSGPSHTVLSRAPLEGGKAPARP